MASFLGVAPSTADRSRRSGSEASPVGTPYCLKHQTLLEAAPRPRTCRRSEDSGPRDHLQADSQTPPAFQSLTGAGCRPQKLTTAPFGSSGHREFLAHDLSAAEVGVLAAAQPPIRASALLDRVTRAAWRTKPSWYAVTDEDRIISPALAAGDCRPDRGARPLPTRRSYTVSLHSRRRRRR